MEAGSVGTSLHFDGREVQNLQELEYQKEEEQQQCELRQMLTNAFDLMDEDILSETSEEDNSHDGSSYQPDSSFTQHQNEQNQNGVMFNQRQTAAQMAGYHQHLAQNQIVNIPQNQPVPQTHQNNVQPALTEIQRPQPTYGIPDHNFLQNAEHNIRPTRETDYPHHQYSSLPSNMAARNSQGSENHLRDSHSNNAQNVYHRNNYGENYFNYQQQQQTPEIQALPNEDAYFTENRYTLERRSSLDISYPNPMNPVLETPVDNQDYIRSSLDYQKYTGHNYQFHQTDDSDSLPRQSLEDLRVKPLYPQDPAEQFQFTSQIPQHPSHHHHQFKRTSNDFLPQHHAHPEATRQSYENNYNNFQNGAATDRVQYRNEDDGLPDKRKVPEPHVLDSHSDEIQQLKILNKARAHEIEDLTQKYESLKSESGREMRIVKHQMTLLEEEKERYKNSHQRAEEAKQILTDENSNLTSNVQKYSNEIERLMEIREDLVKKLTSAETSIENLNLQIVELQYSDTQNRNRQQQEMMINGLQQKFKQEKMVLEEKLSKAFEVISEKEEAIDSLNRELQESNIKASLLEKNESLRGGGNEMYKTLQLEVQELKEQIKHSKSASRLGSLSKSSQMLDHAHDDSMVDLGIRKTLHFNSTPNISHMDDYTSEKIVTELRNEIENNHVTIKKLQDLIDRLQRDMANANCHVDILRKTIENSEKTRKNEEEFEKRLEEMVENEEKLTEINKELSQKLSIFEENQGSSVPREDLDKALKDLDHIKELYVTECEMTVKKEDQLWKEAEAKLARTTEKLTATESELRTEIQSLKTQVTNKDEVIKDLELKHLTAKYSKGQVNSSYVDNLNNSKEDKLHAKTEAKSIPAMLSNNVKEKTELAANFNDDSKDSSLNNSFLKNMSTHSAESTEKSDESLQSNKGRQSSLNTSKVVEDIKKQHKNEIDYVRKVLIEENKTMSVNLHQKMVEMRDRHKNYIKKLKDEFKLEKSNMVAELKQKQQEIDLRSQNLIDQLQKQYTEATQTIVKLKRDFELEKQTLITDSERREKETKSNQDKIASDMRSQYLENMQKIKVAAMEHVRETSRRASEKIQQELRRQFDNSNTQTTGTRNTANFTGTLQQFL